MQLLLFFWASDEESGEDRELGGRKSLVRIPLFWPRVSLITYGIRIKRGRKREREKANERSSESRQEAGRK